MLTSPTKNPVIRFGLIVFLLTALFICCYLFYTHVSDSATGFSLVQFLIGLVILTIFITLYFLWGIYQHEKKLIRFLANVSHDIKTPLSAVIGFAEQLRQTNLNQHQAEQVSAITNSSNTLSQLVNRILEFAKYENSKAHVKEIPFRPFITIQEVLKIIAIQAEQKGILLKSEATFDEELAVVGDPLYLKQILMNLIGNAIKFTTSGSVAIKAQLVLTENKHILKVAVSDTGIGIAAKDLTKIFERFSQVNVGYAGAGLGLAICKMLVEAQAGEISVSSKVVKGSVFNFSIPYKNYEIKDSSLVWPNLAGKRILFVDDNELNMLLAKVVLAKHQMVVDVACNGSEAFELFLRCQYDLILTDIQMPVMNGVDLTIAIRSHPDLIKCNVPILGITASALTEDQEAYLIAGMNDVVIKPFTEKRLLAKIAAQLG